jgi:hypothetical protein
MQLAVLFINHGSPNTGSNKENPLPEPYLPEPEINFQKQK